MSVTQNRWCWAGQMRLRLAESSSYKAFVLYLGIKLHVPREGRPHAEGARRSDDAVLDDALLDDALLKCKSGMHRAAEPSLRRCAPSDQ